MTTEQKAKKYDEALEWMRELYPTLTGADKEDAEHYFPELKESEIKELIEPSDRAFHRFECKHNGYGICTFQSGYVGTNCHITVACNGKCRRMKIWDTKHGYKGVEFKILEEL